MNPEQPLHGDCTEEKTILFHTCDRDFFRHTLSTKLHQMAKLAGLLSAHEGSAFQIISLAVRLNRTEEMNDLLREFRADMLREVDAERQRKVENTKHIIQGIELMPLEMMEGLRESLDNEIAKKRAHIEPPMPIGDEFNQDGIEVDLGMLFFEDPNAKPDGFDGPRPPLDGLL